ncbi:DUF6161 domain-containing protein [Thalassospira lucentensis]|uniref:DUF6161 domain-containing protein n=1 Tax=Thalassospira lucentensis TaxID=168935 RepID=UPI003D27EB88
MTRTDQTALIKFELPKSKETRQFNSFQEMSKWANEVYNQAEDISAIIAQSREQIATTFSTPFLTHHRELRDAVDFYRKRELARQAKGTESWSNEEVRTVLDDIRSRASKFFLELTPTADSFVGTAMMQAGQEDSYKALIIGLLHSEIPQLDQSRLQIFQWKTIREAFAAERRLREPDKLADAFIEKAIDLESRHELLHAKMLQEFNRRSQTIENQYKDFIADKDELLGKGRTDYLNARRLLSKSIRKTTRERREQSAELSALQKTYETHMALEAPAKYWQQKSASHTKGFWWSLGVFSLLVIVSLATIWLKGPEFVTEVSKGGNGFSLPAFAMITIPALFIAWLLKIFANQIASNHHLKQDSVLRQTMITTYLALMKDPGTQVGVEERTLILNAIFRPADRHNDDNGPSAGLIELVRQAKS